MGSAKLIEALDDTALRVVELLLREHSKQREAGAVNLIFTAKSLKDLFDLEGLTTRPHYGIHGLLGLNLDAKAEVVRLLTAGQTQVSLNLYYPWGVLPVFLRPAEGSRRGSLSIDFDPPSQGWFLQGLFAGALPILGMEEAVTGPIPGGGELVVTSFENAIREGVQLSFPAEQAGRVNDLLHELIGRLDPPSQVHVILTGDLKTVRELHETGTVIPCRNCCAWHFEYVDLLAEESDLDVAQLDRVAAFLARRLGRDRALTFRGFTWSWEEGTEPSLANAVVWSVPKRGPGQIEVRWFEPLPRGTLNHLKQDVQRFLSRTAPMN